MPNTMTNTWRNQKMFALLLKLKKTLRISIGISVTHAISQAVVDVVQYVRESVTKDIK